MDDQDFDSVDTHGSIRRVRVLGLDALGEHFVLEVAIGPHDLSKAGARATLALPVDVARELLADLLIEFRELEGKPQTKQ